LLVVIGIIALLISILLPALNKARQAANQAKCMANLRTIGQSLFLYAGAHKGGLPFGFAVRNEPIPMPVPPDMPFNGETNDWSTLLIQFMSKNQGTGYDTQQYVGTANAGARAIYTCPEVDTVVETPAFVTHYTAHPLLLPNLHGRDWYIAATKGGRKQGLATYKLSNIKRSAEVAILFDGTINNAGFGAHACANSLDKVAISQKRPFLTDRYNMAGILPTVHADVPVDMTPDSGNVAFTNTDAPQNLLNIRFRHGGNSRLNALMVDGHVQSFGYTKTKGPKLGSELLLRNIYVNPAIP
jgi:prepilin-type processing-associated H-X9-DG protein